MVREGKVKLSVSNEPGVRSAGGTDLTNDPGVAFDEESAVRRGRAAQRALDVQLCEAVVQAVGESVLSRREPIWNTTLAPQVSRLLRSVGRLAVNSVRSGRVTTKDAEYDRAMTELTQALGCERELRSQQRSAALAHAIEDLFRAEPVQPGADVIARKVGRSAIDVRDHLKLLIEQKRVLAVGNGRSRRYRWIERMDR